VAMEYKFGISLTDDDAFKIQSVNEAIKIMNEYSQKGNHNTNNHLL
jgi:acyl carrier protein